MPYASAEEGRRAQRLRYFIRRRVAIVYLGGRCELCGLLDDGYDTAPHFEFDHIDPRSKQRMRSQRGAINRVRNSRPEIFWAEIEKCQLLCCECHQEKTEMDRFRIYEDELVEEVVPF